MGDPIENEAHDAVFGDREPDDTKAFDGFTADVHGKTEESSSRKWTQRLGVEARESDFAPIPSARELLDQAAQTSERDGGLIVDLPEGDESLPDFLRNLSAGKKSHNTVRQEMGLQPPPTKEESLQGSVWRLSQQTLVNFARAQAAFILAQNQFIVDQDTRKVAGAQHVFIEAQAAVLAKFGVT